MSSLEKLCTGFLHNRLKVSNIKDVINFYTTHFGMKILSEDKGTCYLGFTGNTGKKYNTKTTFLELSSDDKVTKSSPMVNMGRQGVYWKIGVNLPDVDLAVTQLSGRGIHVSDPGQFLDVGYLCHTQDPGKCSIELLQTHFEGKSYTVLQ
jgi:predicted enzyme related to lactoylglutathione lyase